MVRKKTPEEVTKEKRKAALDAMNNIVPKDRQAKQTEKPTSKSKREIEAERKRSAESKAWEQKRKQRYQEQVWRGWRTSEKPSKVKTYNINDIKE